VLVLPGEFGPPTQELKARAFDLKLGDNLVFAGPVQDIHSLIDSSLFCVFSSNMEGCPNGVLEPMGQGKAVIGTSLSGVHQALGDRYADICLSKPNDPDDLAARILGLLRDAPLREKIARYNHDRIGTDFSVENMVRRYLGLVEQGLGKVAANDADCRHWADE
jgi:glycosyltransferase involved in cell wall biosynthesis